MAIASEQVDVPVRVALESIVRAHRAARNLAVSALGAGALCLVRVRRATAKYVHVSVGSDAGLQAVGVHVTCACACIAHAGWDCCGRAVIISTSQQTTLGSVVCRSCGSAKSWR